MLNPLLYNLLKILFFLENI